MTYKEAKWHTFIALMLFFSYALLLYFAKMGFDCWSDPSCEVILRSLP